MHSLYSFGRAQVTVLFVGVETGMSRVANLSTDLSEYQHSDLVRRNIQQLCQAFMDLGPHLDIHEAVDGTRTNLVCLLGTIPIFYKGHRYNIPVCLWLLRSFPYSPPEVHVKPTETMEIQPGKCIDRLGQVRSLPYLVRWQHPQSDLVGLVHSLVTAFGVETPVIGKDPVSVARAEIRRREHHQLQFQNDSNFREAFAEYTHPGLTKEDICDVLQVFPELKPKVDTHRLPKRARIQSLVCLTGTLSVVYQGVSDTGGHYNIPVCIWILPEHPDEAPEVVIKPTEAMIIRQGRYVDSRGNVKLPFGKWEYPKTSLPSLVRALAELFSQERPLITKPVPPIDDPYGRPRHHSLPGHFEEMSLDSPTPINSGQRHRSESVYTSSPGLHPQARGFSGSFGNQPASGGSPAHLSASALPIPINCSDKPFKLDALLAQYRHMDVAKQDILRAMKTYTTLDPVPDTYYFEDGTSKSLLSLQGTVPVRYEGSRYNIPVCIWLRETHPRQAPIVYVAPTEAMQIVSGTHVDNSGKITLPYLQNWDYATSSLYGLIQVLARVFSEEPPVASKPTTPVRTPKPSAKPAPAQSKTSPAKQLQQELTSVLNNSKQPPVRSPSYDREIRELRERNQCKICMDADVGLAFQPCGHLVACRDCAPALITCPMCRATITGTVQIYLS